MSKASGHSELQGQTVDSLGNYSEVRAAIDTRRRDPRPGDLFLLFETAEQPVEWAVVAQDFSDPERILVVPADTHSQVGGADVEVGADARCGPLVLRCGFGTWVRTGDLTPVATSGSLEAHWVLEAQARWTAVETGTADEECRFSEVDGDPDYQDWQVMLAEARSALAGNRSAPEHPAPERLPERSARRFGRLGRAYALAASILLATALAFIAFEWRRRDAGWDQALVNLPVAWLTPSERIRGAPSMVSVPGGAELVLLVLEIRDPTPYPNYRLRILESQSGKLVWSHDRLNKTGALELAVVLPRRLLAAGEYRLHLDGLGEDSVERVAEFFLAIDVQR